MQNMTIHSFIMKNFASENQMLKVFKVSIIFVFLNISCTTMKNKSNEQNDQVFTSKLSVLDNDLELFAKKHHTQVTSPKTTYYPPLKDSVESSLENREISWMDGDIAKAILIQPHQMPSGRKSDAWDFLILAWIKDAHTFEKPHRMFFLLKNAGIDTLRLNIEKLLSETEQKLNSIQLDDLQ